MSAFDSKRTFLSERPVLCLPCRVYMGNLHKENAYLSRTSAELGAGVHPAVRLLIRSVVHSEDTAVMKLLILALLIAVLLYPVCGCYFASKEVYWRSRRR